VKKNTPLLSLPSLSDKYKTRAIPIPGRYPPAFVPFDRVFQEEEAPASPALSAVSSTSTNPVRNPSSNEESSLPPSRKQSTNSNDLVLGPMEGIDFNPKGGRRHKTSRRTRAKNCRKPRRKTKRNRT
jgi:hypothetical protein